MPEFRNLNQQRFTLTDPEDAGPQDSRSFENMDYPRVM